MENYSLESRTIEKTTVYSIGFSFWIIAKLLETTVINDVFTSFNLPIKFLQLFGIIILIASEFFSPNHRIIKHFIPVLLSTILLCLVPILLRRDVSILQILVMAFFGRDINYNRFFKILLLVIISFRVTIFIGVALGIVQNVVTYRDGLSRYNLGYDWTTFSMQGFFYIVCMLIVVIKNKVSLPLVIFLELINIVLYKLTDSRSPFMLITLLLISWFLIKIFKFNLNKSKLVKIGSLLVFPLMSSFIFFTSIKAERFPYFNEILSNRLALGKTAYQRYGVSLFGSNVTFTSTRTIYGQEFFMLDSSFLRIIFSFGLLTFFIFVIVWTLLQIKLMRLNQGYYLFVLIFIVIHSTFDPQFLQAYYNLFVVLFGLFFVNKKMAEDNFSDI